MSLKPIGRRFQWQLRRLTWTNLFERSSNQTLFPAVFFPLNTRNTFDFSCYHLMKPCGFLHGCISQRAKFCSLLSQFLGYFQLCYSSRSLYITKVTALFGIKTARRFLKLVETVVSKTTIISSVYRWNKENHWFAIFDSFWRSYVVMHLRLHITETSSLIRLI